MLCISIDLYYFTILNVKKCLIRRNSTFPLSDTYYFSFISFKNLTSESFQESTHQRQHTSHKTYIPAARIFYPSPPSFRTPEAPARNPKAGRCQGACHWQPRQQLHMEIFQVLCKPAVFCGHHIKRISHRICKPCFCIHHKH